VRHCFDAAVARLRERGAEIVRVEVPGYEPTRARLAGLLWSEADAFVEHEEDLAARPAAFSPEFRKMLEFGATAPAARLARAQRLLRRVGHGFRRLFDSVEIVAAPTA